MKKLSLQRLLPGILATVLSLLTGVSIQAQVAINTTGDAPDTSAILDISSSNKGILIPRMDSTSRTAILQSADGLMVYDTTTTTFWYYDEERWNEIRNGADKLSVLDLVDSLPEVDLSCPEIISSLNVNGSFSSKDNVQIVGNYAYVIGGAGLSAINITDLSNPIIESTVSVTSPRELKIQGQYAFLLSEIGSQSDLVSIDISDPTNMVVLDQDNLGTGDGFQLEITENVAYILRGSGGTDIYDINDPTNLNLSSFFVFDAFSVGGQDMTIESDYLYAIDREFLEVVDIGNPSNPNSVRSLSVGNDLRAIAAVGSFVYVVDASGDNFKIIDVSVPSTPSLTGTLVIGGLPNSVKVSGNYAFVTDAQNNDLKIIDLSDSSNPVLVASFAVPSGPLDVVVADNYAYVISSGSFSILRLNCSTVSAVFEVNSFTGEITATNIAEIQNGLGTHTATMDLDMANFNILNANTAQLGNIDLGSQGVVQRFSNQNNNGFTTTPWVYTNAIEAQGERNDEATLITIGNDSIFGADDEIHLITYGNDRLIVAQNGDVAIEENLKVGDIHLGDQSNTQASSNQADKGFTTTPWVYTNAIEAQGERGPGSTLVTIGNDGTYGVDHEIHLVTNGNSGLMVADNGEVGIGTSDPEATLDLHAADGNTRGRIIARRGSRNSYIAMAGPGGAPYHSTLEVAQFNTGTVESAIAISNENNSSFGYVGIGRVPSNNRLEVGGNASKNTPGDWRANSDARLKKNIQQLNAETTLEKLLSLRGITYEWNDDKTDYERPEGIQYGFTAQNIQEVFPTLVEEDADGYLQTAYGTYDAMYVEALRALRQQIVDQQEKNTHQQRQIDALRTENQELQQQVARIQEVEATLATLQQQLSSLDHSTTTKK